MTISDNDKLELMCLSSFIQYSFLTNDFDQNTKNLIANAYLTKFPKHEFENIVSFLKQCNNIHITVIQQLIEIMKNRDETNANRK